MLKVQLIINKISGKFTCLFFCLICNIIYISQAYSLINNIPNSIQQLIVVKPFNRFQAQIFLWQKRNNTWIKSTLAIPAVVGSQGVVAPEFKFEGDQKTPTGLYSLGPVFATQAFKVKMDFKYVTAQDKYIDDPNSSNYNQWITGNTAAKSFEIMDRKDGIYDAGIIINYNTAPIIKNKGSAIFMHIWYGPNIGTTGCVAVSKDNILKIVKWLDKKQNPAILILNYMVK
ncbi:MAG: hypothetical protein RL017_513 [Pseudomonadota bacterium]|jgi:L,D-peptidoglycan transpeptidase YkuD (ErfK/YbiS/YcfS/YnhG family)